MDLRTFYKECVKRKVFKGISIYAISSWLIIQVAATTFPYLGFPTEAVTTVIILVLLCFPISIIFSWYYNVVPEPEDAIAKDAKTISKQSNRIFFGSIGIISIIVMVIIFLVSRKNFNSHEMPVSLEFTTDQVAVLQFKNNSTDASLDVVGKMVSDWVSHGIIQYEIAPVLNYESINQLANMGAKTNILSGSIAALGEITSYSKLIQGAFMKNGDELVFQSSITDRSTGKQFGFPIVKCKASSPLDGIEIIKQQILTYFLGSKEDVSGEYIPLYDAYKEFIIARDYWRRDYDLADQHLDKSLEIDSNFYQAAFYKTALYYNLGLYPQADSLVDVYMRRYDKKGSNIALFDYFRSMLNGKYKDGARKYRYIFSNQPSDIYDNGHMLVLLLNYLNKIDEVDEIYNLINESELDLTNCSYCRVRLRIKAIKDIATGNALQAQESLEKYVETNDSRLLEVLIKALIVQEKYNKLDEILSSATFKLYSKGNQAYLNYIAARESALTGKTEMRDKYISAALALYDTFENENVIMKARCYYLLENYDHAFEYFKRRYEDSNRKHAYSLSRMIAIHFMVGDEDQGNILMKELDNLEGKYDYGNVSYLKAHIYAKVGDKEKALSNLEDALLKGKRYGSLHFQYDPHLKPIHDDPGFSNLLTYWH